MLAIHPSDRVKVIPTEDGEVIRVASGHLDVYRHLCEVHYRVWRISKQHVVDESEETHRVRFFFPQEIELLLSLINDFRALGCVV